MVNRRAAQQAEAPGQDSFLDVVANLVGILIILVMVIGVRARDAMLVAAPVASEPSGEFIAAKQAAADAQAAAVSVEQDIHRLNGNIQRQELEAEFRRKEREKVQLLVAAAETALEREREKLNQSQRTAFDSQRSLLAAREELKQIERDLLAAQQSAAPTAVIDHLPTPMAKTVFGEEIHLRLEHGRLTVIPWDELIRELQKEAPNKVWRLKDQDEMTETLGPIGGFWMNYTLRRFQHQMVVRGGTVTQSGIEFDQFILVPVSDDLGEPLAEALQEGSQFHTLLKAKDPQQTTITVWTYPDSFATFRELKLWLFQRGFLTASRPLPADQPIGGSPRGSRSAAQ